jgi:hypothetical protein
MKLSSLFSHRRSILLTTIQTRKLSIRMVAGFVDVAERKENLGCGGPIRTQYTIPEHSFPQRIAALRRASLTNDSDS